jgi:hypothetical protein
MLWLEIEYFITCVIEVANASKDSIVIQFRISGGHGPQMLMLATDVLSKQSRTADMWW